METKSDREYARRGFVVLFVAAAVIVYLVFDPGWPFLVSVVIFIAVVPALAWVAAGAIYPKGDRGLTVPIDRGTDDGFAIYLDVDPTGEMQAPTEMFLMMNGASLQSIEKAGLTTGSPVFTRVEEGEARKILADMVEFGIAAHVERGGAV